MDLKSGYPFWAVRNGLMQPVPPLHRDLRCDVAVIGGGSTAASTALLQYEIDTPLTELAERYGERAALAAYRECARAVQRLGAIARRTGDVDFATQDSLYYASHARDLRKLAAEFAL